MKSKLKKIFFLNSSKNIKPFIVTFLTVFCYCIQFQSAYSQNYKRITAKKGEGIYAVLRNNGLPNDSFNRFIELNKIKLNENLQLVIGTEYFLPIIDSIYTKEIIDSVKVNFEMKESVKTDLINLSTVKDTIYEPLLGEKYQRIIITNPLLKGTVFYLDAGHGGPDPGAVAQYQNLTLCEDEYAYDITLRLYSNLLALGATVYLITRDKNDGIRDGWYLTPDKDETCYPDSVIPLNAKERLEQRTEIINKLYAEHIETYQRLLVIHVDSRSNGERVDVFFYNYPDSYKGRNFASTLRDVFDLKYKKHQPYRGYSGNVYDRDLFMLQNTKPVSVFIELGNIQHEKDLKRLIIDNNRQALANWLTEGIIVDFKNNCENASIENTSK